MSPVPTPSSARMTLARLRREDFRIGELRAEVVVFLAVEADTDTGADAAAAVKQLICRRAADLFNRQPLHFCPRVISADARITRIDHILDAGNCQRCLGDVGRQDDPCATVWLEDAVLVVGTGVARMSGKISTFGG